MSFQQNILDLLPPIYSTANDSIVAQLLAAVALEMEVVQEDIDRMRQTHWVNFAWRLEDLEQIAHLVGVERFPWETLPLLRARLLALVVARRNGAVGPNEIQQFTFDYLRRAEKGMNSVFVPGLQRIREDDYPAAFKAPEGGSKFRPLELVEYPNKLRRSVTLLAIGGRVPYLYRWTESNKGIEDAVPAFAITGLSRGRTAVPILANLTTGELIGYRGVVPLGRTLTIQPSATGREAVGKIDGRDVTASLFSVSSFRPGVPFEPSSLDAKPLVPRLVKGPNQWFFLSVGFYDTKGLNYYFFAIADDSLREGVFNETFFDHALFPSGPVAGLRMEWMEMEPASFEVRVPRYVVIEPAELEAASHENVAEALRASIQQLHAAGVKAEVRFVPFHENQRQCVRVNLPWLVMPAERGSAGRDTLALGARFGESGLGGSRFE